MHERNVLNACSHAGLLDEARMLFRNMTGEYGIVASIEHHTCMVSVFGCAGHFEKAMLVIEMMPSSSSPAVWLALLDACKKWGTTELGKMVFTKVTQFVEKDTLAYIPVYDNGTQMEVYATNH